MIRFVGEFNSNLKFIEKMYDVKIFQNGNNLKISGSEDNINLSKDALLSLYETAGQGNEITKETLHLCTHDQDRMNLNKEIKIKTPKKIMSAATARAASAASRIRAKSSSVYGPLTPEIVASFMPCSSPSP